MLGEFTGKRVAQLGAIGWGRMWIGRRPTPYGADEPWGIDNGAYRMWSKGLAYDWTTFERRLLEAAELARSHDLRPVLVVVPDRVAEGWDSLWASMAWLQEWTAAHDGQFWTQRFPWFLAVQDGMTPAQMEQLTCHCCPDERPILEHFDGLFLGGTVPWKYATAQDWRALATRWELRLHYGRAGTLRKLEHAHQVGADSCDSAFPMWTRERWRRFEEAWQALGHQLPLLPDAKAA